MRGKLTVPVTTRRAWQPFRMLEDWRHDFGDFWNGPEEWKLGFPFRENGGGWMPRMDAFRKKDKLVVKTELPGIEKKDVHVTVEDGDLVLKGERHFDKEVKEEDYFRSERTFGEFYRRMTLPQGVDPNEIHAKFDRGLLEIEMPFPKEPKTETREIELN